MGMVTKAEGSGKGLIKEVEHGQNSVKRVGVGMTVPAAAIARAKVQRWDCTQCVLETETSWLEHGFAYGGGGKQRQGGGIECSGTVHQRFAHKRLLMIGLKGSANGTLR